LQNYRDKLVGISKQIKQQSLAPFQQQGLTVKWLPGPSDNEALTKEMALNQGIRSGPVCATGKCRRSILRRRPNAE
jgi:hypothetical protein